MKHRLLIPFFVLIVILSVVLFQPLAQGAVTLTTLSQSPKETKEKYKEYWDDTTITVKPKQKNGYEWGKKVATLTIPKLEYYELPVFYGSDVFTSNWQITTPGYLDGWDMFGESGCTAVGAHNYQLFGKLPTMVVGDKFIIETDVDVYIYEVIGTHIYDHTVERWDQVAYQDSEPNSVTLMTCYPIEAVETEDMYLVYSKLVRGTVFE